MNIAVLSGKGGTGKTTVSTNLSLALNANYVDCDVEEPNGFLFLKPNIDNVYEVEEEYPVINKEKCVGCGMCVKVCNFNALAKVKDDILVFDKLCHSCGACQYVCKFGAIEYKKRVIGRIESGSAFGINIKQGILNIGEPMAVPVIKKMLSSINRNELNVIDCPPGTSCNVVNSLKYSDFAVLVTEPSNFGLHDLKLAIELVKMFNIPFGVVINKDNGEENIIKKYCINNNIRILGTIPFNKKTAELYSKGEILYFDRDHKNIFDELVNNIREVLPWS
ncbi:ATP-binding protein [Caloramator sp. ALD01]|uniref:ATP-binding protein n=1 Tax=Caloramator sp. ALD01 TaxID=1031288 RepID=UPI00040E67A7|nr:ATP-binding protein [Caloramator sp. ALD01]